MPNHTIKSDSWVQVFTQDTFGGRATHLRPGQREMIRKIGSIIVGPGAIAKVVDGKGRELLTLPPKKIISNFPKVVPQENASRIHVVQA